MSDSQISPNPNVSPSSAPTPITSTGLRQFLDISPDALITVNQAGMIMMVNSQAEILFGYPREELLGQQLEILLPQRFRKAHIAHRDHYFSAPLARPMGAGLQLSGRRKDGMEFPVDISLRPLLLDGVPHAIGAIRDVAEQKMLEEQLQRKNEELDEQYRRVQEANRLKSEFLANMSHELRTPLNGIIGFTELIYDGEAGPISNEQHEYLGDILSSSKHLLQIINDLLDLAKVEAGKMTFHPEVVDLEKLVSEVRDIVRPLTANKRIRIEVMIDSTLAGVTVDPSKFKQVLYNYLSNAIKFTPDEGQVTIRIRPEGENEFTLEVKDTGTGIQPEDLGRLFVEFRQLDTGTAKKYQGTGLGLALTKRIIEAQGGKVGVRSTPGQGSTFFATLPRVARKIVEADESDWRSKLPTATAGSPIALVIEDEAKDQAWLTLSLLEAGFAVEVAATGAEALNRCCKQTFDLITLDLLLPDLSGWDVLKSIRSEGPNRDVPVIVITLVTEKKVGLGFPIQDMLSKPVEQKELLVSLERTLKAQQAGRSRGDE